MRIGIIGAGVVGYATGYGLKQKGYTIMFYDNNISKLDYLQERGFKVVNYPDIVYNSDVIMLCLPTPTINGVFDGSALTSASKEIAKSLNSQYKTVVVRSTTLPYFTRNVILKELELGSNKKVGKDFGLCHNPEFLRAKSAIEDFINPNRIVIGSYDEQSASALLELYKDFEAPIIQTTIEEAETIKYVSNLFLASKISFFNEIYGICKELDVNYETVSSAVALDHRIGNYGINVGHPFGGSCLPKDLEAFVSYVQSLGKNPKLLKVVKEINDNIK